MNHYTRDCTEKCELQLRPVPGAIAWPRRLECVTHGYPGEKSQPSLSSVPEQEKRNNYIEEVASPADVYEVGGHEVSQY